MTILHGPRPPLKPSWHPVAPGPSPRPVLALGFEYRGFVDPVAAVFAAGHRYQAVVKGSRHKPTCATIEEAAALAERRLKGARR